MKPADRNSTSRESTLSSALSGERFFLLLAIIIGAFSGLAVVLFRLFIDWVGNVLLGAAPAKHDIRLVLVPALVSLVIGALVVHVFPRTRGSGVNQTKAALYIYDGYISLRTAV